MDKSRLVVTACLAVALGISVAIAAPKVKRDAVSQVSVEEQKVVAVTSTERESEGSTVSLGAAESRGQQSVSEERSPGTGAAVEQALPLDSPLGDPPVSVALHPGPDAHYVIPWQSINAGGGPSSSASYAVNASVGQSTIGQASSANYSVGVGYWYGASGGGGGCVCACHANPICNTDGGGNPIYDIFDLVQMAAVAFRNEPATFDGDCDAPREDVDCDGVVNIFDLVRMVNVSLKNEPPALWFCEPCLCNPYPTGCS